MNNYLVKWLYKKVSPHSDTTNKGLIDILFFQLNEFIINNDLMMNIEQDDLLIQFYIFNYNKSLQSTNNEYFELTFHEDIVDMFILFKEISESYGSELYSKGETADCLLNFINQYVIYEYMDNEMNDLDDEIILDDEY
tara:strand:- start:556 stop:969 length:414 start_codon:yes stop_codon:yes gene_type:complete